MEDFVLVAVIGSMIIFVAFFIRSLTGCGNALVSIPLLALLFDLKFVVLLKVLFEIRVSLLLLSKVCTSIKKPHSFHWSSAWHGDIIRDVHIIFVCEHRPQADSWDRYHCLYTQYVGG